VLVAARWVERSFPDFYVSSAPIGVTLLTKLVLDFWFRERDASPSHPLSFEDYLFQHDGFSGVRTAIMTLVACTSVGYFQFRRS